MSSRQLNEINFGGILKNIFIKIAFLFLIASTSQAKANIEAMAGCLDCFNFVAPTIIGAENVSPAEVGLIVYDSYYDTFRGYTNSGTWATLSAEKNLRTVSSAATLGTSDAFVKGDASSAAFTITLPAAATVPGKEFIIKKADPTVNLVTIDANGSETIDGATTKKLATQNESIKIVSNGTSWDILERRIPSEITTYTPTYNGTLGTSVIYGTWKRVGDSMEVTITIVFSGSPTWPAQFFFGIPSGFAMNLTKMPGAGGAHQFAVGVAGARDSATKDFVGTVMYASTTTVRIASDDKANNWGTTIPFTWASGDGATLTFKIPIDGWEG